MNDLHLPVEVLNFALFCSKDITRSNLHYVRIRSIGVQRLGVRLEANATNGHLLASMKWDDYSGFRGEILLRADDLVNAMRGVSKKELGFGAVLNGDELQFNNNQKIVKIKVYSSGDIVFPDVQPVFNEYNAHIAEVGEIGLNLFELSLIEKWQKKCGIDPYAKFIFANELSPIEIKPKIGVTSTSAISILLIPIKF